MMVLVTALAFAGEPCTVSERTWLDARWTVAEVDLSQARLELIGQRPEAPALHTLGRTAAVVATEGRTPLFATNAGIYMEDRRPLGLHIEASVRYRATNRAEGYGNFYLMPNGVFAVGDAGAAVVATSEVPDTVPAWRLATQSGPLLVRAGAIHPAFQPDSRSRKVRSLVAVCSPTKVFLAVSRDRVRFHDTATFARDGLGCADALYLDGTVSEYWTPQRPGVEGDPQGYGGVLVVSVVSVEGESSSAPRPADRPDEHDGGGGGPVDR